MKIYVLVFIFLTALSNMYSINNAVSNTSIYNRGTGGPHSSMNKGFDSFFNNPALLSQYEPEFLAMKLSSNFKGDTLKILNLYLGGDLSLDEPTEVLNTLEDEGLTRLLIGLDIGGPVSIGHIGNNWGWCIRNSTDLYIDLPYLLGETMMLVREDVTFAIGISYPFYIELNKYLNLELVPGVMSRTTIRGEIEIEKDLLGLVSLAQDAGAILDDYPINVSPMFALDFGFLVKINNRFGISGVVKDIYTPILKYPVGDVSEALEIFTTSADTTGNIVYREINFGFSVDLPLGPLKYVVNEINIYIDYFDLLELEKTPLLHLGVGADIVLLDKLHLLAGFNEGLLALGLNVDIKGFDVGFVLYGTEEGSQPGMRSVMNFLFSIGVSF